MEKESLAAEIGELSSELAKYKGENFDYKVFAIFVKFSNTYILYVHALFYMYVHKSAFIHPPPPPLQKKMIIQISCPDFILSPWPKLGSTFDNNYDWPNVLEPVYR